jgi:hypothetical protein
MSRWDHTKGTRNSLDDICRRAGYADGRSGGVLPTDIIFIIDEAQKTYTDVEFWCNIIKSRSGQPTGPRFCLFSSYGNPLTGIPIYPRTITPLVLIPEQRVSLMRSHLKNSPDVCLFYNQAEYKEVIERYSKYPSHNFKLDPNAEGYLFSLTNGHPGAIRSMLAYLRFVRATSPQ